MYMFLYAVYFFFNKTKMTGLLMTTLYFGYMALFSFGFGIMTGRLFLLWQRRQGTLLGVDCFVFKAAFQRPLGEVVTALGTLLCGRQVRGSSITHPSLLLPKDALKDPRGRWMADATTVVGVCLTAVVVYCG